MAVISIPLILYRCVWSHISLIFKPPLHSLMRFPGDVSVDNDGAPESIGTWTNVSPYAFVTSRADTLTCPNVCTAVLLGVAGISGEAKYSQTSTEYERLAQLRAPKTLRQPLRRGGRTVCC